MLYCISGNRTRLFCFTKEAFLEVSNQWRLAEKLKVGECSPIGDFSKLTNIQVQSWDQIQSIWKHSIDRQMVGKAKPYSKATIKKYLTSHGWSCEELDNLPEF